MLVTTRELLLGFLAEITVLTFLDVMGLLPISEVLTDVILLVAVIDGLLVTVFLIGVTVFVRVMVLGFVMTLLVLLLTGRGFLLAIIFFPISEVLTEVTDLTLAGEGLLVVAFLLEAAAFGLVTVLGFVMFLLVLLAVGRVVLGRVRFISLVLFEDIVLEEKLTRR
jgi:hypothetical protein